jgi:ribosomal protein L19
MILIIRVLEKKRLINLQKRVNSIKYPVIIKGDFVTFWYINREPEKGIIRYQRTKGICTAIKYKQYNSTLLLRSLMRGISIEQQFFYYSLNNLRVILKPNIIKYYRANKLHYLRKKKNKTIRFVL